MYQMELLIVSPENSFLPRRVQLLLASRVSNNFNKNVNKLPAKLACKILGFTNLKAKYI